MQKSAVVSAPDFSAGLTETGRGPAQAAPVHAVVGEALPGIPATGTEVLRAVARAKRSYAMNGRRTRLLGDGLFGDPAWEILLDLFISTANGVPLSVSAVCIGSRTPAATAIRYIGLLGDAGLVVRVADRNDGRRSYVQLTELGWRRMLALFLDEPPAS